VQDIHVKVVYASAVDPYNDPHADPASTVGALKAAVFSFFNLQEGSRADGALTPSV